MVLISVLCPHCHSDQVVRGGKTKAGQQRYKCQNTDCPRYSFQLDLLYKGRAVTVQVVQVMRRRASLLRSQWDEGGVRVQAAPGMQPDMPRSYTQGHGDAAA
jgi:transposase-like protein